ncbi:MAG: lysine biosynthesis protein LysW [Candidatus Omnitrophota bacterium]
MAKVKMIKCPECQDEFELEDYLEAGDTTFCASCDAELRVTKLDPPQVEIVTAIADDPDFGEAGGGNDRDF